MEQKKLKYLQPNNGTWFYRRSVPTELLEHPYWEGKKFWSMPMNLSTDAPQDAVNDAWNKCNSHFNDIVETMRSRNIHVLNEIDMERRATNLLKMYDLKPGDGDPSFQDVDKYGVKANNHMHFVDAVADNVPPFQDLMEWSKREGYKNLGEPFPTNEIPAELQVSERAWILFTNPAPTTKPVQFGDLWPLYERQKQLNMHDRNNMNKRVRWERFYQVVGDDVVTTQAINEGLRTWKEQRLRDGKVQDQTINKELRQIVAILNHAKRELALDLNWVTPKIEIRTQERERPVIAQEHYRQIFDDITDTKQRRYAPWKEFVLTILCQSSAIMSELMRLERKDIHLDAKTPYINLYDTELKTEDRKRIVPIVFRHQRLKDLLIEMDQGQASALPPSVTTKTSDGYIWTTSESNANHALNRYFQTPSLKEFGYTTYCTRHSFTLYLKMARTDSNDLLYLCGLSGNSAQSKMLKHYGRQGIGDPQMVAQLAQSVRKALHFLDDSEGNVTSLYTA